jgi:hypothetical protein
VDQVLISVLGCGSTVEAAANKAGVSQATVYRRKQDPEFKRQLEQFRSEIVERTGAMLTAASLESTRTLIELQQATVPPAVRLGAARATLEIGTKVRELAYLEARMAALERKVEEQGGTP